MLHPIAYLTCELKGRDLASRLLIASHLIDHGYAVVVGQQWSIFSHLRLPIPRGAVLFKSANKLQAERMGWGREGGHIVFAADEECLPSAAHDYVRTTDPMAADACHFYLALNELHAAALRNAYPALANKVEVAGSARIDLLRAAKTTRPTLHQYVLFNTSFGIIRSTWGDTATAAGAWMKAEATPEGPLRDKLVKDRIDFETAALAETTAFLDWMLAHSPHRIVVRPHPQEDGKHWAERYGDKVEIVTGSDPVQWMQHAVLTVHSESTTGVEAAILGAPVLNLSPPLAWRDRLIVSEVNPTVAGANDAIAAFSSQRFPPSKRSAQDLFPQDGAKRCADLIARALPPPQPMGPLTWNRGARPDMHKKKFTVSLGEIESLIRCKVTALDDSIFLLRP